MQPLIAALAAVMFTAGACAQAQTSTGQTPKPILMPAAPAVVPVPAVPDPATLREPAGSAAASAAGRKVEQFDKALEARRARQVEARKQAVEAKADKADKPAAAKAGNASAMTAAERRAARKAERLAARKASREPSADGHTRKAQLTAKNASRVEAKAERVAAARAERQARKEAAAAKAQASAATKGVNDGSRP